MKITSTPAEVQTHTISGLTDDELRTIEYALYYNSTDVGEVRQYDVWDAVNNAVIDAGLEAFSPDDE